MLCYETLRQFLYRRIFTCYALCNCGFEIALKTRCSCYTNGKTRFAGVSILAIDTDLIRVKWIVPECPLNAARVSIGVFAMYARI